MGYLPAALRNYLARLGWSHGDDEMMSLDDMIRWFEIEDVNKGAARFDFQKLEALNGVHMRQMDDDELLEIFIRTLPYLENGKAILERLDERRKAQLLAAMPGLKERAKTLVELADGAAFLFAERPLRSTRRPRRCSASRPARLCCAGAHARAEGRRRRLERACAEAAHPRLRRGQAA